MRVLSMQLKDFKSYQDQTIDLAGVSLASVVGANGAGKSSIPEAIVFALTGARTIRSLDSFIREGCEECRVSLTFALDGTRYRVTRTRSSRGSGKSPVELARKEAGMWVAEGTGAREIDQRLSEILAIDEETLLLTSIIAQGDAGSFFALRPAQRLEAFGAVLRLDAQYGPMEHHWKQQAEQYKAELGETRRDMERLEADAETLETRERELLDARLTLAAAKTTLEEAEREALEASRLAEEAKAAVPDTDEVRARLRDLEQRRLGLLDRQAVLNKERETLLARVKDKAALQQKLGTRSDIEAALEAMAEAEKADAGTRQQRAVLEADLRGAKQAMLDTSDQGKPKAAELERLKAQAAGLNDRVCDIRGAEAPVCDRCGQPIADEALGRTLDQLETELDNTTLRRDALQGEVEALRAKLALQRLAVESLEAAIAALPPLTHDLAEARWLQNLLEELNEIPAKLATIAAAEERLVAAANEFKAVSAELADDAIWNGIDEARAVLASAEEKAEALRVAKLADTHASGAAAVARERVTSAEKAVARHEEAVEILGRSKAVLEEAKVRARALEEDQADADLLRKAFSKWGVPALIVRNVLLALEREVNELLALYDGGLAIRFESEKETRDGSRDSLEIMVYDGNAWRDFGTFSGGEKYRVASAMRLGLARLLACRSGSRVKTLLLDEPEGLDVEGRQHLVRILERLSADVDLVLVLSHYADLQEALPSQVRVTRDAAGLSQVEVVA